MITLSTDRYNLICGKTGSGKSTYLGLLKPEVGVSTIIFDPNDQHEDTAVSRVVPGEDVVGEFERLVRAAMKRGNTHIIVEEAQEVLGTSTTPYLKLWLRTGRNAGVTATFITQIPSHLYSSIVSNAASVVVFRLQRPEDKGYLASWLGIRGASIGSLKNFEFIEITDGELSYGEICQIKGSSSSGKK